MGTSRRLPVFPGVQHRILVLFVVFNVFDSVPGLPVPVQTYGTVVVVTIFP
jgi:hypothetical protein